MSEATLIRHRRIWSEKPVLRALYADWYRDIVSQLVPGRTLEVGGGSGNLKEAASQVICTDVAKVPWLDAVADAQALPFANGSMANLVLFDVLHHIENVRQFFAEAIRVLRPGGRLVIMDPYVSLCSWPVYHFLHPEPVDLAVDPLEMRPPDPARQPFDANQAVATILFERSRDRFEAAFPQIRIVSVRRLSFWAYPLSGGFDHSSLIPTAMATQLLPVERALERLGRWLAFRLLVVLERHA